VNDGRGGPRRDDHLVEPLFSALAADRRALASGRRRRSRAVVVVVLLLLVAVAFLLA
jgi:hypothetical protein